MRSAIGLLLTVFAVWAVALVAGAAYLARGAEPAGLRWERHDDDQFDLVDRAGYQLGGWRVSEGIYRARTPAGWSAPCESPVPVPECCRHERVENYGIDLAGETRRGWSISGQPVSADEALAAVGGPAIPDDATKPYVFWVGDDATGQRVKADAGDRARVQAVPPGHWMTQDRDGKVIYTPGLWFLRADGTVVAHEAGYAGGGQIAEGLRRCDPNWRPESVPDLKPPAPGPLAPLAELPEAVALPGALAGGGALSLLVLLGRRWLTRAA